MDREKKGLPKLKPRWPYFWEDDASVTEDYTEFKLPESPSDGDFNDATEH